MEHITMVTASTFSGLWAGPHFDKLWIGEEERPTQDRSISQWLDEMQHQGWILTTTSAVASTNGILCKYDFERLIPVTAVETVLELL